MSPLETLGWSAFFEAQEIYTARKNSNPARIIAEFKNTFLLSEGTREFTASLSGRFFHQLQNQEHYPVVGDWVLFTGTDENQALITGLFRRKSQLSRRPPHDRNSLKAAAQPQILAGNLDFVFIVMSLNLDFNMARLQRALTLVWESSATPVVLLSKADLCDETTQRVLQVETQAPGVDVLPLSSLQHTGVNELKRYLQPGKTACLIGSSGVGKSTLTNLLCDRRVKTLEIREDDDKGKHATTTRRLFLLPQGGVLIDTPGLREFGLAGDSTGLAKTFEDIESLAGACKFRNCTHTSEPGCAVITAVEQKQIPTERWKHYLKLRKELDFYDSRNDPARQQDIKKEQKQLGKLIKAFNRQRQSRYRRVD